LRPNATLGVLDVTKYFGTTSGGIKTYLLEKSRYVATRPHLRQILVIPGAADEIVTGDGWRSYALRGPRIPAHPPYRFLLATRSFRRIVEHERPDLIEVGSPFLVPWLTRLANRRLQARTVWYYHSHLPRLVAPDPARASRAHHIAQRAMERYVRFLGGQFPAVICGSRFAAREIAALGVRRVVRIPMGVDLDHFHPGRQANGARLSRELGLPIRPFAVFAGRLAEEKRIDVVLDSWPEVERRTGLRLVIAGAGPHADRLRAHRHAGRATWLPWQDDRHRLADLLALADLYLAPGPSETFGLTVVEAMASGTPVVAVDAGAGVELVRDSGAGCWYPDGNPEGVVAAVTDLLEAGPARLGQVARAFAETHHAWESVFDRTFALYQQLVEGRPIDTESSA